MIHVIEIREILPSKKQGTVKFKSTANLTYNCNKEEFNGHWAVGEKYKIDYNVSSFQGSNGPVEMKWVNQARFWKDGDGAVNPPEKEAYKGGGGYGGGSYQKSSGGGSMKDNPEKTADIHRQVAAKVAGDIIGNLYQGGAGALTNEVFEKSFPDMANVVLKFIEAAPKSDAGVPDSGSAAATGSDSAPEDEFASDF